MTDKLPIQVFDEAIKRVLAHPPGRRRWRAANNMWLSLSPRHQEQYQSVIKENKEFRDSLSKFNKFALGQDGNLRQFLNIPTGAYYAITRADPTAFTKKENAAKMFKEFPEYRTAEVY